MINQVFNKEYSISVRSSITWCFCALSIILMIFCAKCASTTIKPVTFSTRLLFEADSLFDAGKFQKAKEAYNKIRTTRSNTEDAKRAQFKLGYLNIYYKNQDSDWREALREFKIFSQKYPADPKIEEVNSWIRILTVIKSFEKEFKVSSNRVERLMNQKTVDNSSYRSDLDSVVYLLKAANDSRDSLAKNNYYLENVILDLEKKCQQAGR